MNDYSEIAHGHACLEYVLKGDNEVRERCEKVLSLIDPGLYSRAVEFFDNTIPNRMVHTYLLAISEHGAKDIYPGLVDEEDRFGRLSMWRAYSSGHGVALVFNPDPIFNKSDALGVYSSPVFYGSPNSFSVEFARMLAAVEQNITELKALPLELVETNLHRSIHFSSLASKHPGFEEEREWRVTLSADPTVESISDEIFNSTSRVRREYRDVNGVPQRIYKVPFTDHPEHGLVGLTLPAVLKKVIVGPTQFPLMVWDAIVSALLKAGVEDADKRVIISGVPLRT